MEEDYPPLIGNYLKFCQYRAEMEKSGILNLTDVEWFYPTTLLPLFNLVQPKGFTHKHLLPKDKTARSYFSYIMEDRDVHKASTAIPIIQAERLSNSYVDRIYSLIIHRDGHQNIKTAIKYIINEIVANIDEHSGCNNSIFMAQSYPKKGFSEIAFFDNGVTIPGRFRAAGKLRPDMSDSDAIKCAIDGVSTKPEGGRGHGLPSTTKILKAMNSDILVVSGAGAAYLNGTDKYLKEDKLYMLGADRALNGTIISFRIYHPIMAVNIYEGGYL